MQSFEEQQKKLIEISNEYKKLCELLNYEEVVLDKKLCLKYTKQKQLLEPIALKFEVYQKAENNLIELEKLKNLLENSEKQECEKEISFEQQKLLKFSTELEKMLITFNATNQNIIIEIVANKSENSLKILEVLKQGYQSFCEENNFNFSITESKNTLNFSVTGLNCFEVFKNEIGFHSIAEKLDDACQVFVYLNLTESFSFNENDLKITTARSSGAGGQHINTTDSAIRVTHLPTNISAVCQNERSQFQNKQKAIENLKKKVEDFYNKQKTDFISKQKKEQLKTLKVVKNYDFKNSKILNGKNEVLISDFLSGKIL